MCRLAQDHAWVPEMIHIKQLNCQLMLFAQYDDFIVTHIQQTLSIHFTGNFMPWHRWFTYSYEKALRDECGYKGYQPVHFFASLLKLSPELIRISVLGLA